MRIAQVGLMTAMAILALACGGGSGGGSDTKINAVAPPATASISGQVDASAVSKTRFAPGDGKLENGEVLVSNIGRSDVAPTDVLVLGGRFSATVQTGDLSIDYMDGNGLRLRKILPGVGTGTTDAGTVDLDTTVVAELLEKIRVEFDPDIDSVRQLPDLAQALADMRQLLKDSNSILRSTGAGMENKWGGALVAQAVNFKVAQDVRNKVDISAPGYAVSDNEILDLLDDVAADQQKTLPTGGKLYLPGVVVNKSSDPGVLQLNKLEAGSLLQSARNFSAPALISRSIAIVPTVDASFTATAISGIDANSLHASPMIKAYDTSDTSVVAAGRYFYVLGRYNADFIEKFDVLNPSVALYHYSTVGNGEGTMNPQSIILIDESKAIIPRLGSTKQWIVNPSAAKEADFKTGEIDLSHYLAGTDDGSVEATEGVVVGGKVFIVAQRLVFFSPDITPYVVVLDAATNQEIDTGKSETGSGLKGIALPARNPGSIQYNKELNLIFVQCTGAYFPQKATGGVVTINPDTFETKLLVDDGDDATATGTYGGLVNQLAVVDKDSGFLAIYKGWMDLELRSFNPSTGEVGAVVEGLTGVDIRGLAVDPLGRLWISSSDGIRVLNPTARALVTGRPIATGLIPNAGVQFAIYR